MEEKSSSMLSLQQELDALREERAREKDIAERRARQDLEELEALRERCEILESSGGGAGSVSERRSVDGWTCADVVLRSIRLSLTS